MKPLAIDLFCGLGGWSEGLLAEGWDVVGFDIEGGIRMELQWHNTWTAVSNFFDDQIRFPPDALASAVPVGDPAVRDDDGVPSRVRKPAPPAAADGEQDLALKDRLGVTHATSSGVRWRLRRCGSTFRVQFE